VLCCAWPMLSKNSKARKAKNFVICFSVTIIEAPNARHHRRHTQDS
jgi:hypothetical protein